jgi:NAD-dependent deacetylase
MTEHPTDLARAKALLQHAQRILVMTGAGISAESGVPTFRGAGGLWKEFRPEDLATPEAFARDPRLVWEWYAWRRSLVAKCQPNPGHLALARWIISRTGVSLVTQNVDALHEAAARQVAPDRAGDLAPIRLHGSLARTRCSRCDFATDHDVPVDTASIGTLPHCPDCGGLLRPDVVWFGESLPATALQRAAAAGAEADLCLVVGTAGAVYPAAAYVLAVERRGRPVLVVDPGVTAFDQVARVKLAGTAGELLPALLG